MPDRVLHPVLDERAGASREALPDRRSSSSASGFRGRARLADGADLAYEVHGTPGAAPPLFLIRALGGSMALWGSFRDRLAEQRRVISFDARGSGASAPIAGITTTRRMARDVLALADRLGCESIDVFGQSLGGMVASWLPLDAPYRVRKLILASTSDRGATFTRAGLLRGLALAKTFLGPGHDIEQRLAHRVLSDRFRRDQPEDWRHVQSILRASSTRRRALLAHVSAGAMHDLRRRVREISCPVLVLAGEIDELLGIEPQQRFARRLPNASFSIVPGSGHDVSIERPDQTASLVLAFLAAG